MKWNRTLDISRATLNRYLRIMEDEKIIIRKRRHRKDPELGMVFKSTLYFITKKGLYMLMNLGVNVQRALKRLLSAEEVQNKKPVDRYPPNGNGLTKIGDKLMDWVKRKGKNVTSSILWNL